MKTTKPAKLPGSIWNNHGHWYWNVKLPGQKSRHNIPLKMPGSEVTMSADKPFAVAEKAAWREWEKSVHDDKRLVNSKYL